MRDTFPFLNAWDDRAGLESTMDLTELVELRSYSAPSHPQSILMIPEPLLTRPPQLLPLPNFGVQRLQPELNQAVGELAFEYKTNDQSPGNGFRPLWNEGWGGNGRKRSTMRPVDSIVPIFSLDSAKNLEEKDPYTSPESVIPSLDPYSDSGLSMEAQLDGLTIGGEGGWKLPLSNDPHGKPPLFIFDPLPPLNMSRVVATFEQPAPGKENLRKERFFDTHGIYRSSYSYSIRLRRQCHLNDFTIDGKVPWATGGFGSVFKALDKRTGQKYAIKRISAFRVAAHPEFVFAEEAIHSALDHPNIVKYYCTMVDGHTGDVYFLLELIDGLTLTQYVNKLFEVKQRLSEGQVGQIIAQIMMALRYLHNLSLAHRDVKPDNVMVTKGMQVKLLDFGLASKIGGGLGTDRGESVGDSRSGMTVGTPSYLAPEVLTREELVDKRSGDLYALGLVAYFLFTGKHYFDVGERGGQGDLLKLRLVDQHVTIKATASVKLNELMEILLEGDYFKRMASVYACFKAFTKLSIFFEARWPEGMW